MNIILASQSPRRKELLGHIFEQFTILPAKGEETAAFHTPDQYAKDLSRQKAYEIAREHFHAAPLSVQSPVAEIPSDSASLTLIIGADTIVYADDKVLGKPVDPKEAFAMLSLLSGKAHTVYTGVTLLLLGETSVNAEKEGSGYEILKDLSFCEATEVIVDTLTEEEINAYIASNDPFDKAGGYGIQGLFSKHITGIRGDYFNVVGLPVSSIYRQLKTFLP